MFGDIPRRTRPIGVLSLGYIPIDLCQPPSCEVLSHDTTAGGLRSIRRPDAAPIPSREKDEEEEGTLFKFVSPVLALG